ncbi:hypothetical protein GQ600_25907 [Phytophthora cactorum]|nr:hypothetical protein GQ600_27644 [Phytophthora cactorum]KAF1795030.1 hypothetical protein GQ600_25907 [Phytophthora cactorum]
MASSLVNFATDHGRSITLSVEAEALEHPMWSQADGLMSGDVR